jgi:hypothetical protein
MKIYYEPYRGFNRIYDFVYSNDIVMDLSFMEPEEPRLMREMGVDYIVNGIIVGDTYSFRGPLMEQLLPEQIRVLLSHAYKAFYHPSTLQVRFVDRFCREVEQIAFRDLIKNTILYLQMIQLWIFRLLNQRNQD